MMWIYGLVTERGRGKTNVIGRFYLDHRLNFAKIEDARAYYYDKDSGKISFRGNWKANLLWISHDNISILFSMKAVNPTKKAYPSEYEGFISISPKKSKTKGNETWPNQKSSIWGSS